MASRRSRRSMRRQARAEAFVQFNPERSVLEEGLRESRSRFLTGVQVEEGVARGIQAALRAARPRVKKAFEESARLRQQIDQDLEEAFSRLGSAADAFEAAARRDVAASRRRSEEAKANWMAELSDREVRAEEGRKFAVSHLLRQHAEEVARIRRRLQELAREEGAAITARLGQLEEAEMERQFRREEAAAQRRFEAEQNRLDRETRLRTALIGRGGRRGRRGGLSPAERRQRRKERVQQIDLVGEARSWIRQLGRRVSSTRIRQLLQTGQELKDKNGNTLKIPKLPREIVNAAFDLEVHGHLSRPNIVALRRRGVNPIPREWLPRSSRRGG